MDLYLEYNQDLVITPNGSIQFATGWDQTRERIIRSLLTTPATSLSNGATSTPDYIFHPAYLIGLGELVDTNLTNEDIAILTRQINQACTAEPNVDPGVAADILITGKQTNTINIFIAVQLINGTSGAISVTLGESV